MLASVELSGFGPTETLLVCWDDAHEAVRTLDGELRWQRGPTHIAIRTESGAPLSVSDRASTVLPKRFYAPAWLMVRSLDDVADWADVDRVSTNTDDEVTLIGDGTSAVATQLRGSGLIARATGSRPSIWRLTLLGSRVVFGRPELVQAVDLLLDTQL